MTIQNNLLPANYKGVPFLAKRSTVAGGRKTVTHEYPNSDRRFVEDLGRRLETFTIEGIISAKGTEYFQQRDALKSALDSEGAGQLSHPYYGTLNVALTGYSLVEEQGSLGVATFSMTFERTDLNIFPTEGGSNQSRVNQGLADVLNSTQNDIAQTFEVSTSDAVNYGDAQELLTGISDAFETAVGGVIKDPEQISQFNLVLETFNESINANIQNPENLALSFRGLFDEALLVSDSTQSAFNLFAQLFTFGDDDVEIMPTTASRLQRIQNRNVINQSTQINAFAEATAAATQIEFANENELFEVRDQLFEQFNKFQEQELPSTTTNEINELRNQARLAFEQAALSVPKITTISTKTQPLTVLTYQYYGDVSNMQEIRQLNESKDPTFTSGQVQILTG